MGLNVHETVVVLWYLDYVNRLKFHMDHMCLEQPKLPHEIGGRVRIRYPQPAPPCGGGPVEGFLRAQNDPPNAINQCGLRWKWCVVRKKKEQYK